MSHELPRLALATPGTASDPAPSGIALLASLKASGASVQHFRARACPLGSRAIGALTGLPGRHLDAWLMPPAVCRSVFARAARSAELAVIEGTLDELPEPPPTVIDRAALCGRPGALRPIAEALDAPIVAVVPVEGLADFHLPQLPAGTEAVLLDGLTDRAAFPELRRMFELVLGRPVLGALEALPTARSALKAARRDRPLDDRLVADLSASFLRFADLDGLRDLAASRPSPLPDPAALPEPPAFGRRFRVAYAHDEAFGDYFPDTLETLEALGAELVEFSPLTDGELPPAVDLVMIGCGFPDRYADDLSANVCLVTNLQSWACRGLPLYAEGGGCAYLGRSMRLGDRVVAGANVLPFDAELLPDPEPPAPVERVLSRDSWLAPAGTAVRGYHSNRWRLRPAPDPGHCPSQSGSLMRSRDAYYCKNAVGSLIHLHLAALPEVVAAFAGLRRPTFAARPIGG